MNWRMRSASSAPYGILLADEAERAHHRRAHRPAVFQSARRWNSADQRVGGDDQVGYRAPQQRGNLREA